MDFEKNQLLSITDVAIKEFKNILFDSGNLGYIKLSLNNNAYCIDVVEDLVAGDEIFTFNSSLEVIINSKDFKLMKGLSIDYIKDELGGDFVILNPNINSEFEDEKDSSCCCRNCRF